MFQRILVCGEYQFKTKNGQSVEARGSFEEPPATTAPAAAG
jgi:hypothetical protein